MTFRLPKTRSMDNLLSAFENGLPLTRTSSDPSLNQHCQEGPPAPEPPAAPDGAPADVSEGLLPDARLPSSAEGCDAPLEEACLTTQPLPSPPLPPAPPADAPVCQQIAPPAVPPPPSSEGPSRTAQSAALPPHEWEPPHPLPCPAPPTSLPNGDHHPHLNGFQDSADLLALKQLTPLLLMEDSTETLTGEGERPPTPAATAEPRGLPGEDLGPPPPERDEEDGSDLGKAGEQLPAAASRDSAQNAAGHLMSQSHLSDLSLLGSHWDSIQGLVQSACSHSGAGRLVRPGSCQGRRPGSRPARAQAFAFGRGPQCCCREALCPGGSQPALAPAARSGPAIPLNGFSLHGHQAPPTAYASPPASCSPPPPQAPAYLDDDGLPVALDAVQQRLRQIEAGYKQEVEVLRQQVRQLQMRLESNQHSSPPSEPDVDYEDDIVSVFRLPGKCCVAPCVRACACVSDRPRSLDRPVCGSLTTATRTTLCPPTVRTVCPRAAGTEWSPRTLRSASF